MEASSMQIATALVPETVAPTAGQIVFSKSEAAGDMRAFLVRSRPESQAEALRLLRNAFPDAPLSLRVAACGLASI